MRKNVRVLDPRWAACSLRSVMAVYKDYLVVLTRIMKSVQIKPDTSLSGLSDGLSGKKFSAENVYRLDNVKNSDQVVFQRPFMTSFV